MEHLDANADRPTDPERAREIVAEREQSTIVQALIAGNVPEAVSECERIYGGLVGRYFMALLGDLTRARALAREAIDTACRQWPMSKPDVSTFRAHLLAVAKKRCALELTLPNGGASTESRAPLAALEARKLLMVLRPSERELLALRYVTDLSHHEVASILGTNATESQRRISGAISEACYATDPRILPSYTSEERKAFLEHLVELIDGTAPAELRARIAEDDRLRDELHVALQVTRRIAMAAEDFVPSTIPKGVGSTQILPPIAPTVTIPVDTNGTQLTSAVEPPAPVVETPVALAEPPAPVVETPVALAEPPAPKAESTGKAVPVAGNVVAGIEPLPKKSAWLVAGLATAAVAVVAVSAVGVGRRWFDGSGSVSKEMPVTTVSKVEHVGLGGRVELCNGASTSCRDATGGVKLNPGDLLRTSGAATAQLALDALGDVRVEPGTELIFDDESRAMKLVRGRLNFDITAKGDTRLEVQTANGIVDATRGKFAVAVEPERTRLEVLRGQAVLVNRDGQRVTVQSGEQGSMEGNERPQVFAQNSQSQPLSIVDSTEESVAAGPVSRGLGELMAKKPSETKERSDAVRLSKHHVSVRIVGAVAKTEIEEVFTNDTNDVLEGVFRFPLPSDAQIERLALDVDGRLVDGAFVERDRAAAIWRGNIVNAAPQMKQQIHDDIVWVPGPWRDPALLEWQRGNRFELRIYPIPKQGQRRIVLSYTQVLPEAFGRRQYSYPLPSAGSLSAPVNDFSVDLEIRSHDPRVKPLVRGYEVEPSAETNDVTRVKLLAQSFVPKGDFGIEYALPNREQSLQAWAYRPNDDGARPYAAMLLRPKLPASQANDARDFAFIVDTSRSMIGENLKRAVQVVKKMMLELTHDDQVTLLACDSECRVWPEGLVKSDASTVERAARWLSQWTAEGASDPAYAVESALRSLSNSGERRSELVYVGDGTATVGAVRPAAIQNYVRRVVEGRKAQVTAIAVGSDSDLSSLRALARGGKGTVVPFVPGTSVSQASRVAMNAVVGNHLTDVTLELPAGMTLEGALEPVIVAGSEIVVPARMMGSKARGDVILRGRVAEQPFEQRYPIALEALDGERNGFVPRLYAAARIAELDAKSDEASKREAIELSRRFSVASRHTSLLVLESSAMFKAFGLDNERQAQTWTGELESEGTFADAEGEVTTATATSGHADLGAIGSSTSGSGALRPGASGGGMAPAAAPKAAAAAPAAESEGMSVARGATSGRSRKSSASGPLEQLEEAKSARRSEDFDDRPLVIERPIPRPRPNTLVPMRRIWERQGDVRPFARTASKAKPERITAAEIELTRYPDRRSATKQLFDLYVAANDLRNADDLARRWNERDPLDVEAIVARADVAASRGERELAIRILGSVVDVRPGDVGAQQRLMRLYRWQGQEKTACRFIVALAAFRAKDEATLAEALRCTQNLAGSEPPFAELRREVLVGMDSSVVSAVERLASKPIVSDKLSGDIQLFARWQSGDVDLDLALIDPDGHRISWLGAPSRSVISALQVVSHREESLALRGGKPGEYVIEITRVKRAEGNRQPVSGSLEVVVAGHRKTIPFNLNDDRERLGLLTVKQVAKLIPL